MTAQSPLERAATRIVTSVPAGLPAGTRPPAGAVLAVRTEQFQRTAAAGYATIATDVGDDDASLPMTLQTQHDIASVTKVVATTASLMRLTSEGLLGLDDLVTRFIPAFSDGNKGRVTVRDLLQHRGGLWEWQPLYLSTRDQDTAIRLVAELPLRYPPKTARHYSDLGFMLLGRIVTATAGMPLEEAVRELVLEPLGMAATGYVRPHDYAVAASAFGDQTEMTMIDTGTPFPVPHRSADFNCWRTTPIRGEVNDGNAFHALGRVSGHAGLFSTVPDLITFATAMANHAEFDAIFTADVVEEFFAAGPDEGQSLGFRSYSLTLGTGPRAEQVRVLGHPGFVGCAVGFVPGRGIAVALGSNRLLQRGVPVPNERMWQHVLTVAGDEIGKDRT